MAGLRALYAGVPERSYLQNLLVTSMYRRPFSLALGTACGVIGGVASAVLTGDPILCMLASLICLVALGRVTAAIWVSRTGADSPPAVLETIYEIGAWSYAAAIGIFAAATVLLNAPGAIITLMCCNALAYGVGISARNAPRPLIAIGQLLLAMIPMAGALALKGGKAQLILAGSLVLLVPAMISIIMANFRVVRESVTSAAVNERLALKMQQLARTDVVTGLSNRAGLNHLLALRQQSLGEERELALFWLDLDRFKEVNDTLGHPVGDRVLTEIARRLRRTSPTGAVIARFGGDEFIVVFECADRMELEVVANRLLAEVVLPMTVEGQRLEIGASMGISQFPADASDIDGALQAADLALYHSKVNGRNQLSFFRPSMTRNLVRRREIETELRNALLREELSIYFQPIVDLYTGQIRSFEALVRWFHPEKGELRPDEFIPVAEETGVIITLGNWITRQAAKAAVKWPKDVTLAVNLSPLQIRAPGAALGILAALREAGLPPSRLELEVTESVFLDYNETTELFMSELSSAGVRFALDDFGTGYSSLGHLQRYRFGKIKVDRSFVSGTNAGDRSDAIIRAVADMATRLDMEIVAEGLETVEQVQSIRAAGCTLGQGFYFSRPVPEYLAGVLLAERSPRQFLLRNAS